MLEPLVHTDEYWITLAYCIFLLNNKFRIYFKSAMESKAGKIIDIARNRKWNRYRYRYRYSYK